MKSLAQSSPSHRIGTIGTADTAIGELQATVASLTTQLNLVITRLEAHGLLATV